MEIPPDEYQQGKLSKEHLVLALETLRSDRYVILKNAVPKSLIKTIRNTFNPILQDHIEANPQILDTNKIGTWEKVTASSVCTHHGSPPLWICLLLPILLPDRF